MKLVTAKNEGKIDNKLAKDYFKFKRISFEQTKEQKVHKRRGSNSIDKIT